MTFIDSNNPLVGNNISIGPILVSDRENQTSLIYQLNDGLVSVGTRSMILYVTLTRVNGGNNKGNIDNISLTWYQQAIYINISKMIIQ